MLELYLVTKPQSDLLDVVGQAITGGVSIVQLRDKSCSDEELIQQALQLQQILPKDVPLIINDRLSVAQTVGCGLHVGMDDTSPVEARERLGKTAIIGLTIHDRIDLAERYQQVISYVGVGPVFATATKKDAKPVLGVERLREIVLQCPVPVVAIGGISVHNVAAVRATGVAGVAVCSAIMSSKTPSRSAMRLKQFA